MTAVRLAVSITAHERPDVLLDQVRNIAFYCRDPLIIIHINESFDRAMRDDAEAQRIMARIGRTADVLINPDHMPTGWGYIVHGHIANFRLAQANGEVFSHFLLMSSADLFFRHGIESFVETHDFGATRGGGVTLAEAALRGAWNDRIPADRRFVQLMQEAAIERMYFSAHEGQYYTAALMRQMCDQLNHVVTDWNYDAGYPTEEVLFPTLAGAVSGLRQSERPALWLGMGERHLGRYGVARALQHLGLAGPGSGRLMRDWIEAALVDRPARITRIDDVYILSRVLRLRSDPLRMLLTSALEPSNRDLLQSVARRLTPIDLATLDDPGRIHDSRRVKSADLLRDYVRTAPADDLLPTGAHAARHALAACPGGHLALTKLFADGADPAHGGWSLGASLLGAAQNVDVRASEDGLDVAVADAAGTPGQVLTLARQLPPALWAEYQGLTLTIAGAAQDCLAVQVSLELRHPDGRQEIVALHVAELSEPDADRREALWTSARPLASYGPAPAESSQAEPRCLLLVRLPVSASRITLARVGGIH